MTYLVGENMHGGYGDTKILNGCSISVARGEIAAIVGPNGAGKSTAMKALLGLVRLSAGAVTLAGEKIDALDPQTRVRRGVAFVPQTNNVFPTMSVLENLRMGAFLRRDDLADSIEEIFAIFPALARLQHRLAGLLSGGQRQQLAVGRALMLRPTALLLDEPTAGVSPIVADELFDRIIQLKKKDLAILMVEQNARQALEVADTGYVLVLGRNGHTGSGADLLADPEVRRAFLGG